MSDAIARERGTITQEFSRQQHISARDNLRDRIAAIRSRKETVAPKIPAQDRSSLTIAEIKRAVCVHFFLPLDALGERSRRDEIGKPRQIAMFLARRHTSLSFPQIAYRLGDLDHTSVIHGVNAIEARRHEYPLREHIALIQRALGVAGELG